jgi:hypothetical protein
MRLQKKTHDQRQVETPEWVIVPLTHQLFQTQASKEQLHTVIKAGKALNIKALICPWTTMNRTEEERQASIISEWIEKMDGKTTTGQICNKEHEGYLEGRSTYLIAASRKINDRLPHKFEESNDGYLEQILDNGDGIIDDCFTYFTARPEGDQKQPGKGAQAKCQSNPDSVAG